MSASTTSSLRKKVAISPRLRGWSAFLNPPILGYGLVMACLILWPANDSTSEDGFRLAYRYPGDKTAIYKVFSNIDLDMDLISARLMTEYKSHEKLVSKSDTVQTIQYHIDELSQSVKWGGMLTDNEELRPLVGHVLSFKLSPTGVVSDFDSGKLTDLTYSQEMALRPVLAAWQLSIPSLYPELPKEPVKVGDTWDSYRAFSTQYVDEQKDWMTLDATYKVKRARERKGNLCLEIEEVANVKSNSVIYFGDIMVKVSGGGSVKSKIEFDVETGLILKYQSKGKLRVDSQPLGSQVLPPAKATMSVQEKRELRKLLVKD